MPRRKRKITAQDLYKFQLITGCAIAPDGEHVAYAVHRVDRKTEQKHANIWVAPTRSGRPRQFTFGEQLDVQPRWSPNGQQLVFLSKRGESKQAQLYVIPIAGGESRMLTDWQGDFAGIEWSPDSKRIAFAFRKRDAEDIAREADPALRERGVVARRYNRVFFKSDGYGFLPHERWHIWTVDVRTGRARQLTSSDTFDEQEPAWSPDGKFIVYRSNRAPDPDQAPHAVDLFVIPAAGGRARKLATPRGVKWLPRFSPDGKWIAYLGQEGRGHWWKNTNVWVAPANGRSPARNLTGKLDVDAVSNVLNDMGGAPEQMPPTWSADGAEIYFQAGRRGRLALKAIGRDGDPASLRAVVTFEGVVGAYSFSAGDSRLAYFRADMSDPGQIHVRDLISGKDRQITRVNSALLRNLDLGKIETVWFKGGAGNDLQGWILKPPGFRKDRKYPCVVEIHGGPLAQYGFFFMHEFYYLAARGYVVAFSNPRGGAGYGEQHAKAIWGKWGTADYDDVMAFTEYVARRPYVDRKRMGVTGGSYGGYMTNWIIGHTRRFRAAVTQRSVSNLISMYGSSDFNWIFEEVYGGVPPWEDHNRYWRQSPMKYIGNAKTPTLVIHSEQDLRCNIEQGEQVFVALKRLGVETEMLRFPDEPHGLSREGRTDRRIVRLEAIADWFDRYLKR